MAKKKLEMTEVRMLLLEISSLKLFVPSWLLNVWIWYARGRFPGLLR